MKKNHILKICCLLAVYTLGFPGLTALGQRSAQQTFVSSNNRKAVFYNDGRLVFYDGIEQNARAVADVNCFEQNIISSKQGKYYATCSQFFGVAGPARIYNEIGKKVGDFELEQYWKVGAVSDKGDLIALVKELHGRSPYVVLLCDLKGNIIADYSDIEMSTRIKFASDGTPVVWGVKGARDSRKTFVSILDSKGKVVSTHEYPNKEGWIDDILLSNQESTIVLVERIPEKGFSDRVKIWDIKNNLFKTIIISDDLGVIGQEHDISLNGSYAVLQLGGKAISLINTVKGSEILHKSLDIAMTNGYQFEQILRASVTDKGKILVMGHSQGIVGYCVLDKTGKMISSKVLSDFGNDGNIYGRFRIQEMTQEIFAIVHEKDKEEIVNLQ